MLIIVLICAITWILFLYWNAKTKEGYRCSTNFIPKVIVVEDYIKKADIRNDYVSKVDVGNNYISKISLNQNYVDKSLYNTLNTTILNKNDDINKIKGNITATKGSKTINMKIYPQETIKIKDVNNTSLTNASIIYDLSYIIMFDEAPDYLQVNQNYTLTQGINPKDITTNDKEIITYTYLSSSGKQSSKDLNRGPYILTVQ